MAGTVPGGKAAAETNKTKYGANFYAVIGALGGKKGRTGGFWADRELAKTAGAKGGRNSRRGPMTEDQKLEARHRREAKKAAEAAQKVTRDRAGLGHKIWDVFHG